MFGASTPQKFGGLKTVDLFSTTSQLNGKFNSLYLPTKDDVDNQVSALEARRGLLYRLKTP